MPGRLASFAKPFGENFPSSIFRKRCRRGSELEDHERSGNFDENLTRELQKLKPVDGECVLRLEWLHRVVTLAVKKHNEAVDLIPKIDFPRSKPDEARMCEYFDTTTTILEVCNSLGARILKVEHGHLLAKHSICMVEKQDTSFEATNLIRARETLQEWIEVVQSSQVSTLFSSAEREDGNVRLQGMLNGLKAPRERTPAKGKSCLEALYGAKMTATLACTALMLGLSGKIDLSVTEGTSDRFEWASSVSYLVHRCGEEARDRIARGSHGFAEEIENVNVAVHKLLVVLDKKRRFPLSKEETDEMSAYVEQLKISLEILILELEKVRVKLDEFVRSITVSRSALLRDLRVSVSSSLL